MMKLDLKTMRQIDKLDMLSLLLDFPLQCKVSLDIADKAKILFENRQFTKLVFCGMGGSAIAADVVKSYLYFEIKIPILVLREYQLPTYVDTSTLIFLSSYSGNTEETLSAYLQAKELGAGIISLSSDGRLEEYAKKDKVSFVSIPPNLPPRCALGYLSIIPLCILARLGLIDEVRQSIPQLIKTLEDLRNKINPRIGVRDNVAKSIALKVFNKFAVIYSGSIHFDVCAVRLRSQLAENSKALASSHFFPEMSHNEIVGWQNPQKLFKNFLVLMLRDKDMYSQVIKRMDITKEILKKEGVEVLELWSRGEDLLSRIFSLIYIGDFISYYLAILYGVDPTPVERVTYLKNKLAQQK